MRRKIAAGNWKLNGTRAFASELLSALQVPAKQAVEVLVCPPMPYLAALVADFGSRGISFGAQDVSAREKGAYTGEVSAAMLKDIGASHALVGHSERRQHHGETSEVVAGKFLAAKAAGIIPVLCVGETLADGRQRVYAVRRDWLAAWLALCGESHPQSIEVDADLIGGEGSQLLCLGERWLLGGGAESRLALQAGEWPQLQALCPAPRVAHVAVGQAVPALVDECHELAQPYVWLAQQKAAGNLAQGAFARREPSAGLGRWRPLLGLLGLWLVLQWGFNLAQGWQLQREAEGYASASEALYRELFPDDNKLINLRAQFDQHLSEAEGSGQNLLLGLLDQAAQAINAEGAQVRVEQLDFNSQRGDLALNLQAQDFAALERLRTRLQQAGLAVEMGSASREESGVSARLVIGGNG